MSVGVKKYIAVGLFLLCAFSVQAAGVQAPKREFRSAWITTVWAIDWPKNSWGSVDNAAAQQRELVQLLDSLQAANMNAACFQVRGFCDAMYRSKYEPWSKYLTGTRGGEPAYDPLALAVSEAHARGMELHVWLNPYRYASSPETYGSLPDDYSQTHPEWLMRYGDATILNPGLPEVRERIAAVVADILENYDVDGVLFDDYFYLSGTPMSMDADLYAANNPLGLSQADWRRENVNEMVRLVYDTIKAVKPWVTFGIGPAPQVASSDEHAAKYGVDKMPFSDWQYNGIYSDPLAWLSRGTIDYISPQMYWNIESSYSFAVFSAWWSKVSNQFGRHFYASHSVEGSGRSYPVSETSDQVTVLRNDDRNSAVGSVFYSIYNAVYAEGFIRNLRNTVYRYPALPPMKAWERRTDALYVSNITYSGSTGKLSWTEPADNLRYAVYCIPKDYQSRMGVFFSPENLVGFTYTNSCKVPLKQNYTYAVAVVDRYGNEFPPVVRDAARTVLPVPQLLTPADGALQLVPSSFSWSSARGVDSYLVQFATDAAFTDLIESYETADTTFFTGKVARIADGGTYHWRVIARGANADEVVSPARAFTAKMFSVLSPAKSEKEVSLAPLLRCDSVESESVRYTFEVSTSVQMRTEDIVYKAETSVPRLQMPESVLAQITTYYVRCTAEYDAVRIVSELSSFRTLSLPVPVPEILQPSDKEVIKNTELHVSWQPQNAQSFRVELSTVESFAPRNTKTMNVNAYTYEATFTNVAEGNWFLRVRASSVDGWVTSPVLSVVVEKPTALSEQESSAWYVSEGMIVSDRAMPYVLYNLLGVSVAKGTTAVGTTSLPALEGVFVLQVGQTQKKIVL